MKVIRGVYPTGAESSSSGGVQGEGVRFSGRRGCADRSAFIEIHDGEAVVPGAVRRSGIQNARFAHGFQVHHVGMTVADEVVFPE